MDREKVIKGLECCRDRIKDDLSQTDEPCNSCPYAVNGNVCSPWELYDDALAMLKEHEPKEVKDKSTRIKFLDEYFEGECPSCRSFIDEHSNRNFCGYCGQAVKWDT